MAFNAGTNRKAKDFSKYIIQRFKETISNVNAALFDNTITTGTNVVNTCCVAAKNTLITGYETDFSAVISAWTFTKSANYVLGGDDGQGGFQFYPPKVLYEGATDFKAIGKCGGEVWASTSSDGEAWDAPVKFISKGTAGQWDDLNNTPHVLVNEGGTYKILYSGYGDSPAYNYKIGYAYNSTFTNTGWTKAGSFILDVSGYNTKYGTSWDGIQVNDVVKVGTTWYYFGIVFNNALSNGEVIYGVGSPGGNLEDIVLDTRIATFSELSSYYTWIQGCSVFKHPTTNKWYMFIMCGTLTQNATTDNEAIYHFNSDRTDLPIFSASSFKSYPIMTPDLAKNYENNYNYTPNVLKDQEGNVILPDGNNWLYYGGHENGASPTYTGVMCLAKITTIP